MKIPAGIEVQNSGKVFTIGRLEGEGTLGGTCTFSQSASSAVNTWRIGNDDNYSWKGKIVGSGVNVTKIGKGKLVLSSASSFTGKMVVDDGALMLNAGAQLGTGMLTVSMGATLGGVTESTKVKTPLTNSAYTINGTLAPGVSLGISTTGTMDFGGKNVTFGTASVYDMAINRCATTTSTGGTFIKGIASLRMNGTVKVRLSSTYNPAEGDSIKLWEATSFMGTPKFDLPELPLGYSWNTSRAAAPEGWLTVEYDPNGIAAIAMDEEVEVTVVSMGGVQLCTFTCPMGAVDDTFHKWVNECGVYILHIKGRTTSGVMKLKI
jgi:autotransporter-associated beta strand protein